MNATTLRTWGKRLAGLLVFAAMIYLVYRLVGSIGWRDVGRRLRSAEPGIAALAVVALLCQIAVWAERQRRIIRRLSDTPRWYVVDLSLVATAAVNFVVPFARLVSGLVRARYLSRASSPHRPKRLFYGMVLFDQFMHSVVMGSLTILGLILGAVLLGQREVALGLAAVLVLAGLGLTLWLRRRPESRQGALARFIERRAGRGGKMGAGFAAGEVVVKTFMALARDARLWRSSLVLGTLVFAAAATSQWIVFQALDTPVSPLVVITTLALGQTAGVLLGTPGGLGTTEATMIALYGALGVDRVAAASGVLLFRGLLFAVVLGLGLPFLGYLEIAYDDTPEDDSETPENTAPSEVPDTSESEVPDSSETPS